MSRDDLVIAVPGIGFLLLLVGYLAWLDWHENPRRAHRAARDPRVWVYRPEWYWYGWRTLIPFTYGHDEYARRVLVFGWSITGQVCLAVWGCGDPECKADAERTRQEYRQFEQDDHLPER